MEDPYNFFAGHFTVHPYMGMFLRSDREKGKVSHEYFEKTSDVY